MFTKHFDSTFLDTQHVVVKLCEMPLQERHLRWLFTTISPTSNIPTRDLQDFVRKYMVR